MHSEEGPQTHADRILIMEEIQLLAGKLRRATDRKAPAIDEAHVRIVNLAGEIIEFLYADAKFMGVNEKRLDAELRASRPLSPVRKLQHEAVAMMRRRDGYTSSHLT